MTTLRKELGDYLAITRSSVSLQPDAPLRLDASELEQGLRVFQEQEGVRSRDVTERVEETSELYQGEFLEGFFMRQARGFEEWAVQERERLHRLARDALREAVAFHLRAGSYNQGIRFSLVGVIGPVVRPRTRFLYKVIKIIPRTRMCSRDKSAD